jgi:hypothetical protein
MTGQGCVVQDEEQKGPANAMSTGPFDVFMFSVSSVEIVQVIIVLPQRNCFAR